MNPYRFAIEKSELGRLRHPSNGQFIVHGLRYCITGSLKPSGSNGENTSATARSSSTAQSPSCAEIKECAPGLRPRGAV